MEEGEVFGGAEVLEVEFVDIGGAEVLEGEMDSVWS